MFTSLTDQQLMYDSRKRAGLLAPRSLGNSQCICSPVSRHPGMQAGHRRNRAGVSPELDGISAEDGRARCVL